MSFKNVYTVEVYLRDDAIDIHHNVSAASVTALEESIKNRNPFVVQSLDTQNERAWYFPEQVISVKLVKTA